MKKFIPYTTDEISQELSNTLLQKGVITENDLYPGSNSQQIIDVLSYLGSMINTNTTFGVNEMILSQATRKKNILKLSRQLGYEPQRKLSYIYKVRFTVKETGPITINTYTRFKCGDLYYYYMGSPIDREGYKGETIEIEVIEGKLLHYKEDVGLSFIIDQGNISGDIQNIQRVTTAFFDIDYQDIEEDGIEMWVSEPPYADNVRWDKREFNLDVAEHQVNQFNNSYVAIRNIDKDNLRVYFNFAGTGRIPEEGAYVNCVVLISSGSLGFASDVIKLDDPSTINVELSTYYKVYRYGTDEESLESVKEKAPLFHSSAYRAITASDYKVILETNSFIDTASVWGGEEIFPPLLGHIWFSTLSDRLVNSKFDTNETVWQRKFTDFKTNLDEIDIMYLSEGNVTNIKDKLDNYKIITLQTHHEHPKFMRMNYEISIVNKNVLNNDTKQTLVNELYTVFRDRYEKFNASYFNSSIIRDLDKLLGDYNGLVCNLSNEILLTEKDLKGVVSLDEYWQIGEEERYLNTCGICLNDDLASDYAFDINIYLAYPSEEIFDYVNNKVIFTNLPQICTQGFLKNLGNNIPTDNTLWVDFQGGAAKYSPTDNWLSYKIYFDGKVSGKYNILNSSKRKYIHIQLHIGSTQGKIGLDMYDKSGLLKSHFVDGPQSLKVVYPSPNINFIMNTVPILNRIEFK